jgi:hypothetical protein
LEAHVGVGRGNDSTALIVGLTPQNAKFQAAIDLFHTFFLASQPVSPTLPPGFNQLLLFNTTTEKSGPILDWGGRGTNSTPVVEGLLGAGQNGVGGSGTQTFPDDLSARSIAWSQPWQNYFDANYGAGIGFFNLTALPQTFVMTAQISGPADANLGLCSVTAKIWPSGIESLAVKLGVINTPGYISRSAASFNQPSSRPVNFKVTVVNIAGQKTVFVSASGA